jgi:hypothetical protein
MWTSGGSSPKKFSVHTHICPYHGGRGARPVPDQFADNPSPDEDDAMPPYEPPRPPEPSESDPNAATPPTPETLHLGALETVHPVFEDPWELLSYTKESVDLADRNDLAAAYLRLAGKRPALERDSLIHAGKDVFKYSVTTARDEVKKASALFTGTGRTAPMVSTTEFLAEMVYRPGHEEALGYLVHHFDRPDDLPTFRDSVQTPETLFFPPSTGLLEAGVVLLPTTVEEYGDDWDIFIALRGYLSTYLQVEDPEYRTLMVCYILMTWLYDRFNTVPYLRAQGEMSSGKSRMLQVIGSVCYRATLAGGATTVSPIFRIIERLKGTLAIDEADFDRSDLWQEIMKILNCLDGATRIETDRGMLRFAQIVSKRLPVKVRSFDPVTNAVRWADVTDWISGTAQEWFHLRYPGGRHFTQLKCTHGHAVLTPEGFIRAEYLSVGDRVMVQSPALTDPQRQVILGSLIGDASLRWKGADLAMAVPWLTEGHGSPQFEYLDWKIRALDNLGARRSRTYAVGAQKQHRAATYHTARCPVLREFVDLCLDRQGRRQVTMDWLTQLDPLGLAVWFMDDGNLHRSGRSTLHARLSVTGHVGAAPLTDSERSMYGNYFRANYNLNPTYLWDTRIRGGTLAFSAADTRALLNVISPYLRYQGGKKTWVAKDIPIGARDALVPVAITEITKHHYPKGRRYYDVTVGATHTYIANAVASHNTGYQRGFPVLRSERAEGDGEFDVRSYECYGPKLLATRRRFTDEALESRCLTYVTPIIEQLDPKIPLELDKHFRAAAQQLRNKLLLWRFRKWSTTAIDPTTRIAGVEPRVNQILQPLLSCVSDDNLRATLYALVQKFSRRMTAERRDGLSGIVAQSIVSRWARAGRPGSLPLKAVVEELQIEHGLLKISPRKVSDVARGNLGLPMEQRGGYAHVGVNPEHLSRIAKHYSIDFPLSTAPPGTQNPSSPNGNGGIIEP